MFSLICITGCKGDRSKDCGIGCYDEDGINADVLKIYLILYALIRFCDEFLRGDEIRGIYYGLSTAQWISAGIIMFYCVKGMWRRLKIE